MLIVNLCGDNNKLTPNSGRQNELKSALWESDYQEVWPAADSPGVQVYRKVHQCEGAWENCFCFEVKNFFFLPLYCSVWFITWSFLT